MVDATDGNTAETGLTIANTDIDLWKHGATTLADKNSGGATHIAGGVYYATLDATDTNTAGALKIFVQVAGALAWEDSYTVLPEIVYDSFFPAAGAPIPLFGVVDWGTAQASASGALVHRSGLSLADDILNGSFSFVYSGTGAGQGRIAHDFTGATDTSSVSPNWTTTPSTDSLYVTFGTPPASTSAPVASNVTQFGGTAGTFSGGRPEVNTSHIAGSAVSTSSAQIGVNVVQISADSVAADNAEAFFDGTGYAGTNNVIPTVTTATNVTTVNGLAANVITAAATAADFGTEIAAAVNQYQLPDSYAADGAQPTVAQALLATLQALTEAEVSGSTILIKKPDGTTTAMTITCSPSVASATSRTRTA
jgi:hypothetical protein